MQRVPIKLTSQERDTFDALKPNPGEAFDFWREVAWQRDMDPDSLMYSELKGVTGMPVGHGLPWCHPMTLRCRNRPQIEV